MASMSLAGLGAVGCGTDGSAVVKGIGMGAALLWLLSLRMVLAGASLLVYLLTPRHLEQPPVQAEHECRRHSSVYGGKSVHHFLLASYFAVLCPVFGCCCWSTGNLIFREMLWGGDMLCLSVA